MKAMLLATAVFFGAAASVSANQVLNLTATDADLALSFSTLDADYYYTSLDAVAFSYDLFGFNSFGTVGLSYDIIGEVAALNFGYVVASDNDVWGYYGEVNATYTAETDDLDQGDWTFTPVLGAQFTATSTIDLFVEVGSTFDIQNDFADLGQTVELGANYFLSDNVILVPSIVQEFNTANEDVRVGAEIVVTF